MASTNPPLTAYPPKRRIVKRNVACPYCGKDFGPGLPSEEEHVVGRRFVPKGTLAGQWNLILRACGPCNDAKAELEGDVSAVTMQPDAGGRFAADDHRLARDAQRKGKVVNPRTGRLVSEVGEPPKIKMVSPGFSMTMGFVQPAQPDLKRLYRLAWYHLTGFFFLITYDEAARRGWYWTGVYAPIVAARKEDWGNPHLRWIENISELWEPRIQANAAEGYFKASLKRRLGEPAVWSWALEWNQAYRLAGFLGDERAIRELLADLPDLGMRVIKDTPGERLRVREEVPLAEADDTLFKW